MQIACHSEFFLSGSLIYSAMSPSEGNHAHSRSVPECGHHEDRCRAQDDHRSPNRKQRPSLKQVEVPMSQMGRMSFVVGVIMGK
jgi:hypothetical protein